MNEEDYEEAYDFAKELRGDDEDNSFKTFQTARVVVLLSIIALFGLCGLINCSCST